VNELDIWRGETNINGTTWVRQDEAEARIVELEAELKRCEQLRDEYHRLAGERPDTARIAELEAANERWKDWHSRFTDDYRELRLLRAEKAEKTAPEETCGTCAHEWAGTCTHEAAKDRPAPYVQTCRYATSQWTRKGITR
jgi:hypothetical protein